ncbi:MAG: putative dsRNA-binding protein [Bacteroidales bacterium]|nr:putative dsRNA-binding protein [Bacteroidales bacterium]
MHLDLFKSTENQYDKELKKYLHNILGCKPGNIELYKTACIHRSSSQKDNIGGKTNNERLEYLGDAVLDTIIAEFLFNKYPTASEGMLTELRSKLVCRERLNALSKKMGLNDFVVIDSHIHAKCANGDAFEALIGALFLDKGYPKTKEIILKKIYLVHLDIESISLEDNNFKSKIISWGQKNHRAVEFQNEFVKTQGRKKLYRVSILIDGKEYTSAESYIIKKGEQEVAEKAWNMMLKDF